MRESVKTRDMGLDIWLDLLISLYELILVLLL